MPAAPAYRGRHSPAHRAFAWVGRLERVMHRQEGGPQPIFRLESSPDSTRLEITPLPVGVQHDKVTIAFARERGGMDIQLAIDTSFVETAQNGQRTNSPKASTDSPAGQGPSTVPLLRSRPSGMRSNLLLRPATTLRPQLYPRYTWRRRRGSIGCLSN
jgi:hypothetical protein